LNIVVCKEKKCKIYNDENHDIDYYSAEVERGFSISNCSVSDLGSLCYISYSKNIIDIQFEDKIMITAVTIFVIVLYLYTRRVFSNRDHYGFKNWNLLVNEGMLQGIRVVGKPIFGGSSYVFEAYLQDENETEEIYEFGHPSLVRLAIKQYHDMADGTSATKSSSTKRVQFVKTFNRQTGISNRAPQKDYSGHYKNF